MKTKKRLRVRKGPKWEHDCEKCRFLGRHLSEQECYGEVDLYFCGHTSMPGYTLIARNGPGPDYHSSPGQVKEGSDLWEAGRRAIRAGYITKKELHNV